MGDDVLCVDAMGLGVVALLDEHGMRDGVVVQTGDVPERKGRSGGGLAVGRVERAVSRWDAGRCACLRGKQLRRPKRGL